MSTDKSKHLQQVLDTHRMSHIQNLLDKHKGKRDEIKEYLEKHYGDKIYNPINSGSYAKHTAINTKFDLDIVAPFKRSSFDTLEKMYEDVYELLSEKFGDEANVRKQKVSIGIIFFEDDDGDKINIDVVPGRELSKDSYKDSKDLNLHFRESHWGFEKGSHTKTNIQAQIDHISGRNKERGIIRLLKIWKNQNQYKEYKSFLFELITIKAFEKENISGTLWEQLKSVMEYIRDNVNVKNFTLIDPGNSNNNVMNTLSNDDKENLSQKMSNMIERIEEDSDNIKTYFKINEEFAEEDSENKYGFKDSSLNAPIIPKTPQRFG